MDYIIFKFQNSALELGGNAVVGYQLYFDIENSSIAVRGIGTSVILKKIVKQIDVSGNQAQRQQTTSLTQQASNETSTNQQTVIRSVSNSESIEETDVLLAHPVNQPNCLTAVHQNVKKSSPINITAVSAHRKSSSDLDLNSPATKQQLGSAGSNIFGNIDIDDLNTINTPKYMFVTGLPDGFHLLEYPFITMKQFPIGLIKHIGGVVSSRSVKHLGMLNSQDDSESESRDAWWME